MDRELLGQMSRWGRRCGATEILVWMVSEAPTATVLPLLSEPSLAATAWARWRADGKRPARWFEPLDHPPGLPSVSRLPDPRRLPRPNEALVASSNGRWVGWLHAQRSLVGLVELELTATADRPPRVDEAQLRKLGASLAATRALAAASLGPHALAILTPDGAVDHATADARRVLEGPTGAALRLALSNGGLPEVVSLGPLLAWLTRVDSASSHRVVARLELSRALPLSPVGALSRRQREVAELAAAGHRVTDIAHALGCRETTVKTHLRAVYATLGVANRVELLQLLGPKD
ncbi:MAG: LuxR family transcriptional regulator [Deltaproteobacteria bacterium]|nr:MAG: LuxR family transcriptional regulator [Deltaproteobacteria bacterium]